MDAIRYRGKCIEYDPRITKVAALTQHLPLKPQVWNFVALGLERMQRERPRGSRLLRSEAKPVSAGFCCLPESFRGAEGQL